MSSRLYKNFFKLLASFIQVTINVKSVSRKFILLNDSVMWFALFKFVYEKITMTLFVSLRFIAQEMKYWPDGRTARNTLLKSTGLLRNVGYLTTFFSYGFCFLSNKTLYLKNALG